MSGRIDIINGRLVYSCNCGWLDRTHAGMGRFAANTDPEDGVHNLWKQIYREIYRSKERLNGYPAFDVRWKQQMQRGGFKSNFRGNYRVRSGISVPRKKAIALRILLDVAHGFETVQASPPYSYLNDSGFSLEDLISDVLGLYNAMDVIGDPLIDSMCKVVSKRASLNVWDTHLANGLGATKNYSHVNPVYFKCDECTDKPVYPFQFTTVERATYDRDFIPLIKGTGPSGLKPAF